MEKIPKVVVERLRLGTPDAVHPDLGVLTAFYEHTLPDRERNQVVTHLAVCSECREIVALAMPSEEPSLAIVRPVRPRSLAWARIRWALVAAGIVVVGSYGVLRYREASHPATVATNVAQQNKQIASNAKNETPVPSAAEQAVQPEKKVAVAANPATGEVVAGQPNLTDESREFDRLDQFAKLPAVPAKRDEAVARGIAPGSLRPRSLPHGPKPPMQQFQQNTNLAANANNYAYSSQQTPVVAPPPSAEAREQVTVNGQAPTVQETGSSMGGPMPAKKQTQSSDTLAALGRPAAFPALTGGAAGTEVTRAKTAEATSTNTPAAAPADGYSVAAATGSNFSPSGSLIPEPARWSINTMGGLQRSTDQGKTWQDVDVNKGAEGSDLNLQLAMKSSRAKVLAKDNGKKERPDLQPIVFRAVAANGSDVWAGGSGGALYHSADSGAHWAKVVPSMSGLLMTGDVISLQFFDVQHGRFMTSTAEIWNTADGGQNWEKQ